MSFDAHKNLAISTIVTPPTPATSGTNLTVTAGEGVRFPAVPFNATVWPASQPPTPDNAEILRITFKSGDTLGGVRAAEGSTARSIVAGDLIAATITAKVMTDIESGANFPLLIAAGDITTGAGLRFSGGGDKSITGTLAAGSNTGSLFISASGGIGPTLGGYLGTYGNQYAALGGTTTIGAGNMPTGHIEFYSGGSLRGRMSYSGGFAWGGTVDGGPGSIFIGASSAAGTPYTWLRADGSINLGTLGTLPNNLMVFQNGSGIIGSIIGTGAATAFNTTSDARLKTDRGLITDPEVLRSTRVHHFTWNTDGTTGRGVFAQEAIAVVPFAVSVGTDERDESGNLKHPWGVDYSKYVPDLIAGWQQHDQWFDHLTARVAALERGATTLTTTADDGARFAPPPPNDYVRRGMSSLWNWITAWRRRLSWVQNAASVDSE